ncbi:MULTISPECIES: hypothetical protein [unclassified Lysobacter]|uniref:hypothetical protein n=1 Tax=unclassified Lysobacter TaxID=2635362 RepID=UPI001F37027C|nr:MULTISPECIES: hypothetical protein [unclassified Lysobacter]
MIKFIGLKMVQIARHTLLLNQVALTVRQWNHIKEPHCLAIGYEFTFGLGRERRAEQDGAGVGKMRDVPRIGEAMPPIEALPIVERILGHICQERGDSIRLTLVEMSTKSPVELNVSGSALQPERDVRKTNCYARCDVTLIVSGPNCHV